MGLDEQEMRTIRGREISLIFQDPIAGLNPMLDVGSQVGEVLQEHLDLSRREAREQAEVVLGRLGLPNPSQLVNMYPFQLSGGMAQRVMIGMALALNPKLVIADEPTSSLDVTIQAQILEFLKRLRRERNMSIVLISHDLGVMASMAEDVAVMYAGTVVELTDIRTLYRYPSHPYTWGLMQSLPQADGPRRRLHTIEGLPPSLLELPDQCPFLPRCHKAISRCRSDSMPPLEEVEPGQWVACYNPMSRIED
jgi:oligopeptide/dipeptide ABC transporter ATP-binding protein